MFCTNCIYCYTAQDGGYCCNRKDIDCEPVKYCRDKRTREKYNPYDDEEDYDDDFNNFDD